MLCTLSARCRGRRRAEDPCPSGHRPIVPCTWTGPRMRLGCVGCWCSLLSRTCCLVLSSGLGRLVLLCRPFLLLFFQSFFLVPCIAPLLIPPAFRTFQTRIGGERQPNRQQHPEADRLSSCQISRGSLLCRCVVVLGKDKVDVRRNDTCNVVLHPPIAPI